MFTHVDTRHAALQVERALACKRAHRLAPLLEAAKRSRSAPMGCPTEPAATRRGRLARAVGSLRWVLRPAHA